MSTFGYLLLLTSDALKNSDLGQAAGRLAAAIASSGIQLDIIVIGNNSRESVLADRTLEKLQKLPQEIIVDDRLTDGPTLKEFFEDRIVPMLLQRQSIVVIAPTRAVMTRLSEIANPQRANTG
ncbi:hypothetical protein [Subtercola vilae]|uniref:Uncharacterized protein n=1 Tax=Subtercola vilae TaxID=2056433 RepID=A0A4T2BQM6_9MICO|nr:hypothetical protein [Subtercola vilae]TIH33885.1 hypothetical protein D4765_13565 [Subtercola vilae]